MGKKSRVVPQRVPTKRQLSRWQREKRIQRLIVIGGAIAVFLILAIPLVGFTREYVLKGREVVARVNQNTLTLSDYTQLLNLSNYQLQQEIASIQQSTAGQSPDQSQSTLQYLQQAQASLPYQVVDNWTQDQLVRQEASARGITVTPEEIDAAINPASASNTPPDQTPTPGVPPDQTPAPNSSAGQAPAPNATAAQTPTPGATPTQTPAASSTAAQTPTSGATPSQTPAASATPSQTPAAGATPSQTPAPDTTPAPTPAPLTPEQFQTQYNNFLKQAHTTDALYRSTIESSLLEQKLRDSLAADIKSPAPAAHVLAITVATQDDAKSVMDRLGKGEDFATVAKDVSTDPQAKDNGGDLGWVPHGLLDQPLEDAIFSAPIGQLSGPVQNAQGYTVFKVLEKQDSHDIDQSTLDQVKSNAFDRWLQQAQKDNTVENLLNSDQVAWAQKQIGG